VAIKSVYKADNGVVKPSIVGAEGFTPVRTAYQQEFELLRAVNEQQHDRPSLHNKKKWEKDNSHVIRVAQVCKSYYIIPLCGGLALLCAAC